MRHSRPSRSSGVTTTFRRFNVPAFIDSSAVPPRADMSDAAATRQMAQDMREAAYREGGMTRDALQLLGYTAAQIDRLVPAARLQADRLAQVA